MSLSLREQLLQAGLGTKKQAKQAEHQNRPQPRSKPAQPSPQALAAQQAQAAKAARDQELNRKQQEKAEKKARRAQVRQVIEQNRVVRPESDEYYNFIDGKMIRRMAVTAPLREQLTRGELVPVRYSGHYELVPVAVIPRIEEIDASVLIQQGTAEEGKAGDENDPYKDFVVPDDLTW
jgi:hypothetical protein